MSRSRVIASLFDAGWQLHKVVSIKFHKVAWHRLQPLEVTCLLVNLRPWSSDAQEEEHVVVAPIPDSVSSDPYGTSLLLIYAEHVARHVWEGKLYLLLRYIYFIVIELWLMLIYLFLQEHETIKSVNDSKKILNLEHNADTWIQDEVCYFRLPGLCSTRFKVVNHGIWWFLWRGWHKQTWSFHIPHGEISITLDDVLCLLYLSIRVRLLNHSRIDKGETLEMMVNHMGVNPDEVQEDLDATTDVHARFSYLAGLY